MSDTTPRPDEPREDDTQAPDEPSDETTSEAPAAEDVPTAPEPPAAPEAPAAAPPPPPPPAGEQPHAGQEPYAAQQPYGGQQAAPVPVPGGQAAMSPQDERTWSMATHGIILAALLLSGGTLGFVAALVMYLVYKDRGPYIRANTANALNIQIVTVIGVLISFVLMLVLVGFVTIFLVGIYALVLHIIGMVKANNGEWWDPPLTPKFVR
jgi:uncharacterized Tic20 family protein